MQVMEHLGKLSSEGVDELLQSWPANGPSVEAVFSKIFKFLDDQARSVLLGDLPAFLVITFTQKITASLEASVKAQPEQPRNWRCSISEESKEDYCWNFASRV